MPNVWPIFLSADKIFSVILILTIRIISNNYYAIIIAETYRQIKQARRPSKSRKDLLLLLIDGLIREAKEEWKASLLFAFEGLGW